MEIVNNKTKNFIDKANHIHNYEYDYSLTKYINNREKVKIICKKHGIFYQALREHLVGCGCQECSKEKRNKKNFYTTKSFIEKVIKIYNNEYDYSLIKYTGIKNKVLVICKKHGVFSIISGDFLRGHGCPECGKINSVQKRTKTFEQYKKEANKIHLYSFLYFKKTYKNTFTKTKIYCKKCHNIFWQVPNNHIKQRQGYSYCYGNNKRTTSQFINKAIKIHKDRYDYSLVKYINSETKVEIKCKLCNNIFWQNANSHLQGANCPYCKCSEGELKIKAFLNKNKIVFVKQKTFLI